MKGRSVLDELRAGCAEVAGRARFVSVAGDEVIAGYAQGLEPAPSGAADVDPGGLGPDATRADRAAYWLSLDAINFGSGWFPTLRKPGGRSGYGTISAAWRTHWRARGAPSADTLRRLEPADLARILGQDPGHELIELFALSLRDLGSRLDDGFGGSALALIEAADGSAVALASELGGWPCFADRSAYEELSLPFLKRAQIAAADLRRAGVVSWRDEASLTLFADNLVPHVLRLDGVLTLHPALLARIDAGDPIEHGSAEEVEIRACAVHAVERLVTARGDGVTAAQLDELLWTRGAGARYKASPRHRSRCTAY